MDTKQLIRIVWVVQVMVIFLLVIITHFAFPERVDSLIKLLPFLSWTTLFEGLVAAAGTSLKRVTEATLVKAEKGKR